MKSHKKLIIHIGNHKTGTTSIQHALKNNRQDLSADGYHYFCSRPDGKEKMSRLIGWFPSKKDGPQGAITIRPDLAGHLDKVGGDIIISSEYFSYLFEKEDILEFRNQLSEFFPEIKIVVYIRRQDKQVMSHHQQDAKLRVDPKFRMYGNINRALPDYSPEFDLYLDYNQRLGYWADCFGEENMIIRDFERDSLYEGDVVSDFYQALGLTKNFESENRNESEGFIPTKIGFIFAQKAMDKALKRKIRPFLQSSGQLLPSKAQAMSVYGPYRESNRELNSRFNVSDREFLFDEDFSKYPETAQDVWTEESANEAVEGLADAIISLEEELQAAKAELSKEGVRKTSLASRIKSYLS